MNKFTGLFIFLCLVFTSVNAEVNSYGSDSCALVAKMMRLNYLGFMDRSIQLGEKFIEENGQDRLVLQNIAYAYYANGRYVEAINVLKRALESSSACRSMTLKNDILEEVTLHNEIALVANKAGMMELERQALYAAKESCKKVFGSSFSEKLWKRIRELDTKHFQSATQARSPTELTGDKKD